MFYHLNGIITNISSDTVIIECGGIGFETTVTPGTAASLTVGNKSKLFITESIGENNYDLYGFLTEKEKQFFKLLTSVSGIGPKAAISILSTNSPETISLAIINENDKAFTVCPGIGKKTAQRIILELKDKISKSISFSDKQFPLSQTIEQTSFSEYAEAVKALNVLGYSSAEILPILKKLNIDGMKTEDIIRSVLKYMI